MLKNLARRWLPSKSNMISLTNGVDEDVLIDLREVVKNYVTPAGEFTALKGIDLQVKRGEFVAVIGKSGSGKSTLINMITGIDSVTQGDIHIASTPIKTLNRRQMARWRGLNVGVIFQFFQLLPTLSLIENIMLPMEFCGLYTLSERRERALHLLELVGLLDQAYKLPAMVSGGQQQRAAIARALANDPQILVADEPTGSLDSKTADTIFKLFEEFVAQGKTMLMVTHDRDLASRVSRVIYIADGEITNQKIIAALPTVHKDDLVDVFSKLEPIKYGSGEVIIYQGDPANHLYIITKGDIEVALNHGTEDELIIDRLGSGQYFGEMGLIEGGKRGATVRVAAGSDALVMQLDRNTFLNLMEKSDLTKDDVIQLMRERTERTSMGMLGLDQEQFKAFITRFEAAKYEPDVNIVEQGDLADKFYIITKGEVEIINRHPSGQEVAVTRLGYGQYFGEMGLLRGGRRVATVRTTEEGAEVAFIHRETFVDLLAKSDIRQDEMITLLRQRALGLSMGLLGLENVDLSEVKTELNTLTYQPQETIIQSHNNDDFYIIIQGEVEVVHDLPNGQEEVINRLHSGQYFGETVLLQGGERTATIRAGDYEVELINIDKSTFQQLRDQSRLTTQEFIQMLPTIQKEH